MCEIRNVRSTQTWRHEASSTCYAQSALLRDCSQNEITSCCVLTDSKAEGSVIIHWNFPSEIFHSPILSHLYCHWYTSPYFFRHLPRISPQRVRACGCWIQDHKITCTVWSPHGGCLFSTETTNPSCVFISYWHRLSLLSPRHAVIFIILYDVAVNI